MSHLFLNLVMELWCLTIDLFLFFPVSPKSWRNRSTISLLILFLLLSSTFNSVFFMGDLLCSSSLFFFWKSLIMWMLNFRLMLSILTCVKPLIVFHMISAGQAPLHRYLWTVVEMVSSLPFVKVSVHGS